MLPFRIDPKNGKFCGVIFRAVFNLIENFDETQSTSMAEMSKVKF